MTAIWWNAPLWFLQKDVALNVEQMNKTCGTDTTSLQVTNSDSGFRKNNRNSLSFSYTDSSRVAQITVNHSLNRWT